MKSIVYLFSLTLPFLFLSCGNDDDLDKNNLSPSVLDFKAIIPSDLRSVSVSETDSSIKTDTILLFSGKDIAWYNGTSGELKFNDNFPGIEIKAYGSVDLLVYSDNESLFSINLILTSDVMSWIINSPVLSLKDGRYYIKDGYPNWDWLQEDKNHPVYIEREKNWKAIESGWNIFIEQLKKEGRYRK
jgi:hypothetical protein